MSTLLTQQAMVIGSFKEPNKFIEFKQFLICNLQPLIVLNKPKLAKKPNKGFTIR